MEPKNNKEEKVYKTLKDDIAENQRRHDAIRKRT